MKTGIGRPLDHVKEQFWRRAITDRPAAGCPSRLTAYGKALSSEISIDGGRCWPDVTVSPHRPDRPLPRLVNRTGPQLGVLAGPRYSERRRANGVDHTHRDCAAFRTYCPGDARLRSTSPRLGALGTGGTSMLSLPPSVRILLVREPVDMRKGFDGLAHLVVRQSSIDG